MLQILILLREVTDPVINSKNFNQQVWVLCMINSRALLSLAGPWINDFDWILKNKQDINSSLNP